MATALQAYSPRITEFELPRYGKPLYIVNYRVAGTADNPQIDFNGVNKPLREIDWMTDNGIITPQMMQVLDAEPDTYVTTDSSPKYDEGLRALRWVFEGRERQYLYSNVGPWDRDPGWGSLLGSVAEGNGRLKILGIEYFVQPEVAIRGESLWQTQLYAQANDMINSDSHAVNTAYRFLKQENPDLTWIRSEVERFEKNGEGLKEGQVTDLYRQLRQHMLVDYLVRSREILAWPMTWIQYRDLAVRMAAEIPELR